MEHFLDLENEITFYIEYIGKPVDGFKSTMKCFTLII